MASSSSPPTSNTPTTWSDLPDDILCSILIRLPSIRHLAAFYSVCRPWLCVASSTVSPSPTSFFPPLLFHLFFAHRPRRRNRPSRFPSDILLIDPSSPPPINPVCVTSCPKYDQSFVNLHFLSSSHGHLLFFQNRCFNQVRIVNFITNISLLSPICFLRFEKSDCLACLTAPLSSTSSSLLLLTRKSLFIWHVGDSEWVCHSFDNEIQSLSQMTAIGSKIYAIGDYETIYVLDLTELRILITPLKFDWTVYKGNVCVEPLCWLVNCGGELLNVCFRKVVENGQRFYRLKIRVYRLDTSKRQPEWVEMKSLGNRVLFMHMDKRVQGFACENPRRWGGRSNCIYFSGIGDDHKGSWQVFELGDPIHPNLSYHYLESQTRKASHPKWPDQIWCYPKIFYDQYSPINTLN